MFSVISSRLSVLKYTKNLGVGFGPEASGLNI